MDLQLAASILTPDLLRVLPDEELLALADAVGAEVGRDLVGKGERENAVEARLAREMDADYLEDLAAAEAEELGRVPAEDADLAEVNLALGAIGTALRNRDTATVLRSLKVALTALATLSRRAAAGRIGDSGPSGVTISGSLAQADLSAVEALAQNQLWWIGDLWTNHLSRVISATVAREALVTGLGREQVGRILNGVVRGTVPGASVPGTFRGSSAQYFEMLAGTVRTQASNFGALTAMRDAGFTTYRIQAVMDERTSERCRFMHNRTFRVSDGTRHMERVISARDPDEYKSIAGWRSREEMQRIAGDGDAESQRRALSAGGLALPPYHGRCRTVVVEE